MPTPAPSPTAPPAEEPASAPSVAGWLVNGAEFLPGQPETIAAFRAELRLQATISGGADADDFFVITTPPTGSGRYLQGEVDDGPPFSLTINLGEDGQFHRTAELVEVYVATGAASEAIRSRRAEPENRVPFDAATWAALEPPPRLVGGIAVQRVP